jgi:hypothetical protein
MSFEKSKGVKRYSLVISFEIEKEMVGVSIFEKGDDTCTTNVLQMHNTKAHWMV